MVSNGRKDISHHPIHSTVGSLGNSFEASILLGTDVNPWRVLSNCLEMSFWLGSMLAWALRTGCMPILIAMTAVLVLTRWVLCYQINKCRYYMSVVNGYIAMTESSVIGNTLPLSAFEITYSSRPFNWT